MKMEYRARAATMAIGLAIFSLGGCGGDDSSPIPPVSQPPPPPPSSTPPPPINLAGARAGDNLQFDMVCGNGPSEVKSDGFYSFGNGDKAFEPAIVNFAVRGDNDYRWEEVDGLTAEIGENNQINQGSSTYSYFVSSIPTVIDIYSTQSTYPLPHVAMGRRMGPYACDFAGGFVDADQALLAGEYEGIAQGHHYAEAGNLLDTGGKDYDYTTPTVFISADGDKVSVDVELYVFDYGWWDSLGEMDLGRLKATVTPGEVAEASIEGGPDGYTGQILIRSLSSGQSVSGWFVLTKDGGAPIFGVLAAERTG